MRSFPSPLIAIYDAPALSRLRSPHEQATTRTRSSAAGSRSGRTRGPGRSPTPASPASTTRSRRATCSRCCPTPRASPTSATSSATRSATRSPTSAAATASSVIHPMGYDAFGLPAENNAIKTGEHPRDGHRASIASFREQFKRWGISIDWTRELGTHEPDLLPLDPVDLPEAVRARPRLPRPRRRCSGAPKDATVLANEQVIDGHCERCGTLVEQRKLEQWFFKITDYAERLLDGLRAARVLARERGHHAAQLDRPLRGRRGRLPLRRARARLPRLHHPARHPLRRHLLRARARAPRGRAARRRHRARGGGPRLRQRGGARLDRGARRRGAREDRRPPRPRPSPTPSTASRSRCSSPTTC